MELSNIGLGLFSKMVVSWRKGQFCDVTIKCENLRKIKAPSILMGTVSNKLSDILNQCQDSTFTTSDISYNLWKFLLEILFSGSTNCLKDSGDDVPTIKDMLQFAGCLGVSTVVDLCLKDMKNVSEYRSGYRLVDKIPLEFNLVYFVATDQGKERITSICQCPLHDPDLLTNKPDKDASVSRDNDQLADETVEEMSPKKNGKRIVKTEAEEDEDMDVQTVTFTTADTKTSGSGVPVSDGGDGGIRRSARKQGKRKTYTQYGYKEDEDIADDVNEQISDDDNSENVLPDDQQSYDQPYKAKKKAMRSEVQAPDGVLSKKVKVCFVCHSDCSAEFVQCRLCFQVVDGTDLRHVEDEHPLLNNVIWPVTCNVAELTEEEETVMIGRSMMGYLDGGSECGTVYQCMECIQMFASQDCFDAHLREHTLAVFSCGQEGCHFAFKSEMFRTEHQHFCTGGSILKCYACQQILGGMLGYNKHKCLKKGTRPQTPKKVNDAKEIIPKEVSDVEEVGPVSEGLKKKLAKPRRTAKKADDVEFMPMTSGQLQRRSLSSKPVIPKVSEEELVEGYMPLVPGQDQQKVGHLFKCCQTCSFNCEAEKACCLLCGQHVEMQKAEMHVLTEHTGTPSDRLWPVDCQDMQRASQPYVICKHSVADSDAVTEEQLAGG